MAERMKEIFCGHGIPFYIQSPTNQQFVVLENGQMERLGKKLAFSFWEKKDETHTVVRFATGWSTTEEELDALDRALSGE
jgi:threonine aldolase